MITSGFLLTQNGVRINVKFICMNGLPIGEAHTVQSRQHLPRNSAKTLGAVICGTDRRD